MGLIVKLFSIQINDAARLSLGLLLRLLLLRLEDIRSQHDWYCWPGAPGAARGAPESGTWLPAAPLRRCLYSASPGTPAQGPLSPSGPEVTVGPALGQVMRCAEMLLAAGCTIHLVPMSPCNALPVQLLHNSNTQGSENGVLPHQQGAHCPYHSLYNGSVVRTMETLVDGKK